MLYVVYILYSIPLQKFYKGYTNDLNQRITWHNSGYEKYSRSGSLWILLWTTKKSDKSSTMKLERKLKNLSQSRLFEFMLKYGNGIEKGIDLFSIGVQALDLLSWFRVASGDRAKRASGCHPYKVEVIGLSWPRESSVRIRTMTNQKIDCHGTDRQCQHPISPTRIHEMDKI